MATQRRWWEGKKFGRLSILSEPDMSDITGNGPAVECACECGGTKTTRLYPLKSGRVKSCGCLAKEVAALRRNKKPHNQKDRTGTVQGDLTFLELAGTAGGCTFWKVRCACGADYETRGTTRAKSCRPCSRDKQRGSLNSKWKGGTFVNSSGYTLISVPGHHRANTQGYVLEHIIAAEKKTGMPILREQTVHHINGQRSDNRPENLEVWDSAHPAGQRLADKLQFYAEQLLNKSTPAELLILSARLDRLINPGS